MILILDACVRQLISYMLVLMPMFPNWIMMINPVNPASSPIEYTLSKKGVPMYIVALADGTAMTLRDLFNLVGTVVGKIMDCPVLLFCLVVLIVISFIFG